MKIIQGYRLYVCPEAQDSNPQEFGEVLREMPRMAWWRLVAKTLLRLGATRQENLEARRHMQSLPKQIGVQAEQDTEGIHALSPASHVSPWMAEQDIYLFWSHTLQTSVPDSSLHTAFQNCDAQGSTAQTPTSGKMVAGKLAALTSAVPASFASHHGGPCITHTNSATTTLSPLASFPSPINSTISSCRISLSPCQLLSCSWI